MSDRVRRLFELIEARDWDSLRPLLAETVVYEVPQTRERIVGREEYLQFNATFPGEWHLSLHRVVDGGRGEAVAWISATTDGEDADNITFVTFDGSGLVTALSDFWPESYEPPARAVPMTRY